MDDGPLGLGLVGCGAFGLFCLKAFAELPAVRLAAAARARKPAARSLCEGLGLTVLDSYRQVIEHPDVDLVHVAAPPAMHYGLVTDALRAGKHVLCEKPLALRSRDAEEMIAAAEAAGRLLATNFVMRYSPVTEAVRGVLDSGALGRALAAHLTNCASDAGLDERHWFWERDLSGGIFIEHGVHFFDLYAYWFGPGRVVGAQAVLREPAGHEDRVACTVRHEGGLLAGHYHGFDQIAAMDRTDHRIVCELGDVRVEGWLPQRIVVDAAVDAGGAESLRRSLPAARIEVLERYDARRGPILGRGRPRHVTQRVRLDWTARQDKEALYAESIRALLADQIASLSDPAHRRRITERNGLDALIYAEAASTLAVGDTDR